MNPQEQETVLALLEFTSATRKGPVSPLPTTTTTTTTITKEEHRPRTPTNSTSQSSLLLNNQVNVVQDEPSTACSTPTSEKQMQYPSLNRATSTSSDLISVPGAKLAVDGQFDDAPEDEVPLPCESSKVYIQPSRLAPSLDNAVESNESCDMESSAAAVSGLLGLERGTSAFSKPVSSVLSMNPTNVTAELPASPSAIPTTTTGLSASTMAAFTAAYPTIPPTTLLSRHPDAAALVYPQHDRFLDLYRSHLSLYQHPAAAAAALSQHSLFTLSRMMPQRPLTPPASDEAAKNIPAQPRSPMQFYPTAQRFPLSTLFPPTSAVSAVGFPPANASIGGQLMDQQQQQKQQQQESLTPPVTMSHDVSQAPKQLRKRKISGSSASQPSSPKQQKIISAAPAIASLTHFPAPTNITGSVGDSFVKGASPTSWTELTSVPAMPHIPSDTEAKKQPVGESEILANDVLLGRGGMTNINPGNVKFRDLVSKYRMEYCTAPKGDKGALARYLCNFVRSQQGRFLKKDDSDGYWYECGDEKAVAKCGQALREGTAAVIRKAIHGGSVPQVQQIHHDATL